MRDGATLLHIFAGEQRIATLDASGGMHYFHTDHLNSTTVVTNTNGQEVEEMGYLPFGGLLYDNVVQGGQWHTVFRFTGQEYDAEYALYNYNARLYDPIMGRFISPDSMMADIYDPQSLNRYSYCRNNPLIYVDPTGNWYDTYYENMWESSIYSLGYNWTADAYSASYSTTSYVSSASFSNVAISNSYQGNASASTPIIYNDDYSGAPAFSKGSFWFGDDSYGPPGSLLVKTNFPGLGETSLNNLFNMLAQNWLDLNRKDKIDVTFSEGFRTFEYQVGLQDNPNAITPAPPGTSLHEAGWAVDIRMSLLSATQQARVIQNAYQAGMKWGGYFNPPDKVHFYYDPGKRDAYIHEAQGEYVDPKYRR